MTNQMIKNLKRQLTKQEHGQIGDKIFHYLNRHLYYPSALLVPSRIYFMIGEQLAEETFYTNK